jgi:cytosine/adenosine deaminase-related metal-dependent hydrolase
MWRTRGITFVNAVVVGDKTRFDSIRVHGGVIDRMDAPPKRDDAVIDLEGAAVFPGLINAHDHLELNSFPRLKWRPCYSNVREWIADFQPRFATDPALAAARPDTLTDRVWIGGLKNLLAGVTTVCHHNPLHRPLRARFPVRVVRNFGLSHSLQIDGARVASSYRATPPAWPWIIHAAEGVDAEAAAEVDQLEAMGCLGSNTVIVHGVGLCPRHAERVLERGGALIWCPSSNDFLFGRTARVRRFHEEGRLAIGTDSRLSGQGDLMDELRAAHETGQLSAEALVRAVTVDAAALLRLPCAGRLTPGGPADLTVVRHKGLDPYTALVTASRKDVRLTMLSGRPLVGEPSLMEVFVRQHESYTSVRVDGAPRLLASWIARRAARLAFSEPGLEMDA